MDRPRLIGWSSLHRARRQSLTPLVAVAGTASPVPIRRWEAGPTRTSRCAPRVDPRDRDRHRAAPCGTTRAAIGAPSIVSRPSGLPRAPRLRALSGSNAPRNPAHRSRLGAAASCVSTVVRSTPRPAPPRRFALRLLVRGDARCVGPTSAFSRLRTSTRASSVPDASCALRACAMGRSPASRQCDSLRRAARSPLGAIAGGLVVPVVMRANRTSGVPVASPARDLPLARTIHSPEPPRSLPARPRERRGPSKRSGTPFI
jgi:hypothetical protein